MDLLHLKSPEPAAPSVSFHARDSFSWEFIEERHLSELVSQVCRNWQTLATCGKKELTVLDESARSTVTWTLVTVMEDGSTVVVDAGRSCRQSVSDAFERIDCGWTN
uniref:Uncharacterized protein n=1 Tax=Physcomitrium patens TaxID=3218 RepID=A0A2K1IKB5_PHYPA|nr:hypothetical protein PHYPA_028414 [Physcomitrium patens]